MTNTKARALVSAGFLIWSVQQMRLTSRMCSPAEIEMLEMMRKEEEILKTENNSISSTEQAVRDIQKIKDYCQNNGIRYHNNIVENVIKCFETRLGLISDNDSLNKYQTQAAATAIYPGKGTALGLIYCSLKLSGEAGEVADNVGKAIRDDKLISNYISQKDILETYYNEIEPDRKAKIKLELGDILWYVSQAAKELGFTLEEIAQANLDKLAARKEKGTLKGSGDDR